MTNVEIHSLWNFEVGSQESANGPTLTIVGFQQRDRQDSQNLNNDIFCRLPVTFAQCIFGKEKIADLATLIYCDADDYCYGY